MLGINLVSIYVSVLLCKPYGCSTAFQSFYFNICVNQDGRTILCVCLSVCGHTLLGSQTRWSHVLNIKMTLLGPMMMHVKKNPKNPKKMKTTCRPTLCVFVRLSSFIFLGHRRRTMFLPLPSPTALPCRGRSKQK